MAKTKYLDYDGLVLVWSKIKTSFISQPAAANVTAGNVPVFTKDSDLVGISDSGFTIGKSVPSNAIFTDSHVTSVENHYTTAGVSAGTLGSSTARHYIKTITIDAAGHITGVSTGSESVENTNTATLKTNAASSTISTTETPGSFIKFEGGVNKFTISDASGVSSAFDVTITPSIANNVTGTGASGKLAIWNGTNTITSRDISDSVTDNNTNIPTAKAVKSYVDSATMGLTGAMHFIGITTTTLSPGDTTSTLAGDGLSKTTNFSLGDVVLSGKKEFVWTGSTWEELGDEGSWALKSVTVTGTGALSGGGDLTENRTITHNPSGVAAGSYGQTSAVSGVNEATVNIPNFTVDSYGHITAASSIVFTAVDHTYTGGTGISLSGSAFNLKKAAKNELGGFLASNVLSTAVTLTEGAGATTGRYYGVQLDKDGNAFVNIPWQVNTDSYVDSGSYSSQGTNGADGGKLTLSRIKKKKKSIDVTIPLATTSGAGLMSGAMVNKLSGIADGATKVTETTVSGWGFTKNTGTVINSEALTTDRIVLGNGANNVKNSGKTITTTAPTSSAGDTTIPTSAAVWNAIAGASGYGYTGTVTSITPGDGILNGSGNTNAITTSGTLKVALTDYLKSNYSAQAKGASETRLYAVELDKDGKLAVTVPWSDTTYDTISKTEINAICVL